LTLPAVDRDASNILRIYVDGFVVASEDIGSFSFHDSTDVGSNSRTQRFVFARPDCTALPTGRQMLTGTGTRGRMGTGVRLARPRRSSPLRTTSAGRADAIATRGRERTSDKLERL
jgi:hypothetical protein